MPFLTFAFLMWFVSMVPWYFSIFAVPGLIFGVMWFIAGVLYDKRPDLSAAPLKTAILQVNLLVR